MVILKSGNSTHLTIRLNGVNNVSQENTLPGHLSKRCDALSVEVKVTQC